MDLKFTVECWNPNVFGFRTEPLCSVLDLVWTENNAKIRLICSDFGQKILSEIQTIRFERWDFGIIGILMLWMLKSERSKEPNDPKSEQVCSNDWLFGFQHCLDFGRSDFSIPLYLRRLSALFLYCYSSIYVKTFQFHSLRGIVGQRKTSRLRPQWQ